MMNMWRSISGLIMLVVVSGCSSGPRGGVDTISEFLNARERGDIASAEALLAPDARIWFDDLSGNGTPIDLRTGWGAWDREMGAAVTPKLLEVVGDSVVGEFHEVNDFSRLLGFDGWWSRMTFWFDERGRIARQLYQPLADRPSGQQETFASFREWAQMNRPAQFDDLHPIQPGTETAKRWRIMLIDWRRATGQPMPRMPRWEARLRDRVRSFVLAGTWEEFLGQTAPEYQLWFGEQSGDGMGRADLHDLFAWDKAVNSRPEIQRFEVQGDEAIAFIHEENSLTRLLNFGGFNSQVIFRFDHDGRIREQVVIDQDTMPAFEAALDVAIDWLKTNRQPELAEVYVGGQMVFTGESAAKWLDLLREWRRETGQPPVG